MTDGRNAERGWRGRRLSLAILACTAPWVLGCGQTADPGGRTGQDVSAASDTREFAIGGMSCEGCVSTVTSAIKKVPGVQSAEVSLEKKKAVVAADFKEAPPSKIEDAVRDAGYEAQLIAPSEESPPAAAP